MSPKANRNVTTLLMILVLSMAGGKRVYSQNNLDDRYGQVAQLQKSATGVTPWKVLAGTLMMMSPVEAFNAGMGRSGVRMRYKANPVERLHTLGMRERNAWGPQWLNRDRFTLPETLHRSVSATALAALLLLSPVQQTLLGEPLLGAVQAKELASGSGSRVNKDPESLLRLGLPAQSKEVRSVQASLEECRDNLDRLLYSKALDALKNAQGTLSSKSAVILKTVPDDAKGQELISSMNAGMEKLRAQITAKEQGPALATQGTVLKQLSALEELTASTFKQAAPPKEFSALPWLKQRALVEFTFQRDGGDFDVDGTLYKTVTVKMIVDGYTAPITAGNFVDLVDKGFYNGMRVQRSDGFVVQTGDPSKEGRGKEVGFKGPDGNVRKIPLELYVKGDKGPMYGTTFDDDGRGGYAATLPFNAYGALGMAREEYDADSASSQFFWLLFDSDLTPAGKNLLDGRYACFGYTVEGPRLLSDLKEGDTITKASVISGLENLQRPPEQAYNPDQFS